MRISKRMVGVVALVAVAGMLGFGTVTALAGGDITEALKDKEFREEFQAQKEKEMKVWKAELGDKVKNKDASWGATEVSSDVTAILSTELVPVAVEEFAGLSEKEAKDLAKETAGQYSLKIYLDNGDIEQVGPFKKMPKRVELVETSSLGIPGKAIIIEE